MSIIVAWISLVRSLFQGRENTSDTYFSFRYKRTFPSKLPRPCLNTASISHDRTSGKFVDALGEGTLEVHGEKDRNKCIVFQSVRLVGAVGIEITLSSVLKDLRNILRNRKKQLSSAGNAYCCPKAASFFSSRLPHRQQHFYDFTVCFPHRLWDRLRVDVHGCPNVRVAQ
jgi:hypothetical protein